MNRPGFAGNASGNTRMQDSNMSGDGKDFADGSRGDMTQIMKSGSHCRPKTRFSFSALCAGAVLAMTLPALAQEGSLIEICSSNGDSINIRSGSGTSHPILASLENGTLLRVVQGDLFNPNAWIKVRLLDDVQIDYIGEDISGYVLARLTTQKMCQVLHNPAVAGHPASRVAGRDITLGPWDPTHDLHLLYEGHPESQRPYEVGSRVFAAYLEREGISEDPYPEEPPGEDATARPAETLSAAMPSTPPNNPLTQSGGDPTKLTEKTASIQLDRGIYALAVSPDGRFLLTGEADGTARLYDSQTLQELRSFGADRLSQYNPILAVNAVAFSPDGSLIATSDPDWTVRIADIGGALRHEMELDEVGRRARSLAFSPDGRVLASADSAGHLNLWDVRSGDRIWKVVASDGPDPERAANSVVFTRDGASMLVGTGSGFVREYETATGRELRKIEGKRGSRNFAVLSPDNRSLAIFNGFNDGLRVLDTQSLDLVKELGNANINSGVFTSDGSHLILGSSGSDDVSILDIYDKSRTWASTLGRHRDNVPSQSVLSVVLAPDGSFVASASVRGTLIVLGPRP